MNKVLTATALAMGLGFFMAAKTTAQEAPYATEVCVNASLADEAKRLFPDAILHVIPDQFPRGMNGWRIVSGTVGPNGRIHTDAEEIQQRRIELLRNRGFWGVG